MRKFLLFFLATSVFFAFFLGASQPSLAAQEFVTSYNVTYEALADGSLLVSQEVSLTNKFSNIYATEYSLSFERGRPQNLRAADKLGPLKIATKTEGETTTINLRFNEQVVGKDKTLSFTLDYEAVEFIRHSGQIWEVSLPKINNAQEIDDYNLTLKIPLAFGKPAYISPLPKNQKTEGSTQFFFFEKGQLVNSGVVAAFGEFQIFDFSLTYHLFAPPGEERLAKIALPPDTNSQKVAYQKIGPVPQNVEVDGDGNWLGVYRLKPGEKMEVVATGQVKIFAQPQPSQREEEGQLEKYLRPQKYWETENPEIFSLGQGLKTPREIYNFVVKTLNYDYSRVREGAQRLGALAALQNPERAICMEYTDLFIALARTAGIPARELNGFAYTDNPLLQPLSLVQDVLHAWPEYWDGEKKLWVQVDPTWQDTTGGVDYFSKLDLGHFVFAIHGEDSQIPAPAGSYKEPASARKDVQIAFGQYKETTPPQVGVDFLLPQKTISEAPTEGKIRLINRSPEAFYRLKLQISAPNFKLLSPNSSAFSVLPPFSVREVPLKLATRQFLSSGSGKIIVLANNQQFEYDLVYESIILKKILPILAGLLAVITLLLLARRIRNLNFQKKD